MLPDQATSGGGAVVGWLNTKMFDATHDEEKSQGWTALIVDTNGNGRRDAYTEPNQPRDPTKDMRYGGGFYSVIHVGIPVVSDFETLPLAQAQEKTFDLKISHWVPASHPLQKSLEDWGAAVEKESGGTVKSSSSA